MANRQPSEMTCEDARDLVKLMLLKDPGISDKATTDFANHLGNCSFCTKSYQYFMQPGELTMDEARADLQRRIEELGNTAE